MKAFLSVSIGGPFYFLAILALLAGLFPLCALAKKKGAGFTRVFVLTMFFVNLALHFLKLLMPGYIDHLPAYLVRLSAENYCALFVLAAPFLLLSKKKVLWDYLFYMGIISSFAAYLYPTSPATSDLLTLDGAFEITRYYLCHAPLLYGGAMMVASGLHKLDYKRYFYQPLLVLLASLICFLNCILLNAILHNFPWSELFSRGNDFMNSAYALGPGVSLDPLIGGIYPYLFNYLQIYYVGGEIHFTPLLWLIIPVYLLFLLLFPVLVLPFQYRRIKADLQESPFRLK